MATSVSHSQDGWSWSKTSVLAGTSCLSIAFLRAVFFMARVRGWVVPLHGDIRGPVVLNTIHCYKSALIYLLLLHYLQSEITTSIHRSSYVCFCFNFCFSLPPTCSATGQFYYGQIALQFVFGRAVKHGQTDRHTHIHVENWKIAVLLSAAGAEITVTVAVGGGAGRGGGRGGGGCSSKQLSESTSCGCRETARHAAPQWLTIASPNVSITTSTPNPSLSASSLEMHAFNKPRR